MKTVQINHSTVEEVAQLHDVNEWTLRMWINRLEEIKHHLDPESGRMLLPAQSVRLIGEVVNLSRRGGMTIDMVRNHLDSLLKGAVNPNEQFLIPHS